MSNVAVKTDAPRPALAQGGTVAAIVPQDAEQAYRMARMISQSGIAPKDMKTPEAIVVAIMHGLEVGLKPMQAVQSIAPINGRPTIWGDAALGLVEASGLLEDFEETLVDGVATCRAVRKGRKTPIIREFSEQDARTAGLWTKQGPWKQYPNRMLQMRARGFALRDGFPDVLKGLGVREEVRDYAFVGSGSTPSADAALTPTKAAILAHHVEQGASQEPPHDAEGVVTESEPETMTTEEFENAVELLETKVAAGGKELEVYLSSDRYRNVAHNMDDQKRAVWAETIAEHLDIWKHGIAAGRVRELSAENAELLKHAIHEAKKP